MAQQQVLRRVAFIAGYTDGYDYTNAGATMIGPHTHSFACGQAYGRQAWLTENLPPAPMACCGPAAAMPSPA